MSYQVYITDAIVLGSYQSNTADKSYLLFTKRAGMLYAKARSVREERSKQRYALQDFSHITISLVKGKGGWRVGSVDVFDNFFLQANTRAARGSVVKLAKVLRRYVRGEEPQPALYEEFLSASRFLSQTEPVERSAYELCATVRLLSHLGYTAISGSLAPLCARPFPDLAAEHILEQEDELLSVYAAAQAVSHLEG